MILINRRLEFSLCAALAVGFATPSAAVDPDYEFAGHIKARIQGDAFPGDSILHQQTGSSASDIEADVRLNFAANREAWSLDAAWQFYGGYGDRIELLRALPGNTPSFVDSSGSDGHRLMDLSDIIRDEGKVRVLHRLDRLSVGYASANLVMRIGRQAITWGNGLLFSPLDIVNPFDPTAVDTEYKAGDDMLYGQILFGSGNDLQFAHVFRRNPLTADSDQRSATSAIKYHGIWQDSEFDVLLAEHHDETVLGVGGNKSIGGAVWRGDIVISDTPAGSKVQVVTNLSYSWVLGSRNMSGIVEYYFNGFGQRSNHYDPLSLAQNPGLLRRLERGEAFSVGRNYMAGGVLIEMNPLWTLSPNLFTNLDDGSALLQVTTRHSLGDNSDLLAAINIPLGPSGTEFGGLAVNQSGLYFSTDLSVFAQFAFYY